MDFLNSTDIHFDFLDRIGVNDSGWVDASTNAVILREKETILFHTRREIDVLALMLKFSGRIAESA